MTHMPYALRLRTRFWAPTMFHYLVEAAKDVLRKTASSSSPKERADALAAVVALVEKGTKCVQEGLDAAVFGTKATRWAAPQTEGKQHGRGHRENQGGDARKLGEHRSGNRATGADATAQELGWDRTVGKSAVHPKIRYRLGAIG
jgi:hypothetical protein